jgi:hypothetical protein
MWIVSTGVNLAISAKPPAAPQPTKEEDLFYLYPAAPQIVVSSSHEQEEGFDAVTRYDSQDAAKAAFDEQEGKVVVPMRLVRSKQPVDGCYYVVRGGGDIDATRMDVLLDNERKKSSIGARAPELL